MFIAALALALALSQSPEDSGQATQTPPPMTEEERERAEEEAHLDEVICQREHVVGSNRPQRVCQTRRQWNRIRELSQDAIRDDHTSGD